MNMKKNKLYKIWNQVPVNYYQDSTKKNFLQFIWHYIKINNAKKIIKNVDFKNCLDLGCASGYMISQIASSFPGKQYMGVDVYDRAISHAKKKYKNIKFRVVDPKKLPFRNNTFNLIICYETIEHVEDPEKSLKELKRVLSKGGTLLLAMDSGSLLFRIIWTIWENTKGKVWKGSHLHPFHHSELEDIIKSAGFKIRKKILTHIGMEVVFILNK